MYFHPKIWYNKFMEVKTMNDTFFFFEQDDDGNWIHHMPNSVIEVVTIETKSNN